MVLSIPVRPSHLKTPGGGQSSTRLGQGRANRGQNQCWGAFMNQGIRLFVFPVKDIARAKTLYGRLLGVEPYVDEAYYVGFRVGDQEIGLDPNGHNAGMTGPLGYWHVNDIKKSLQSLLDAGARTRQDVRD